MISKTTNQILCLNLETLSLEIGQVRSGEASFHPFKRGEDDAI